MTTGKGDDAQDRIGRPLPDTASPTFWPMLGARVSVRRTFLWLLVLSLLPLLLLGVGRSAQQLYLSQQAAEAGLSQRAIETARWQTEVVRTARAVLMLLSEHPDVRSGGILCDMALDKIDQGFPAFSNISRFAVDGKLVCSSMQPLPDVTMADQPWWPAAHRTGNFMITGPVFGRVSKRQVLLAMRPMITETGGFDGIVSASIDMGWMERNLRSRPLGADAVALVLDGKGRTLVGNRQAQFGAIDIKIGTGKIGNTVDARGQRWTYAVAPLVSSYDGSDALYIAYAMPEARLFSPGWFQAGFSLLQPLVAVLIVSLVIWFGTNGLVLRWLRELRVLAEAFSEGDYRARPVDFDAAPTEFRVLAAALYKMGAAVERRDTELRTALDRQSSLVREIHHRVKNNLQIVMSLLSLQADRLETETGRAAMRQTRLRISSLALVHRLLYETGEQATISSKRMLDGICSLLHQTMGTRSDIVMHCDFDDAELPLDIANPLCLWLVEAAANAWSHAFPDERPGEIRITLTFADGDGTMDVIDNGIGLAEQSDQSPPTRGLRILAGIAKQLGGTSTISAVPGDGTRLRLRFPLPPAQGAID